MPKVGQGYPALQAVPDAGKSGEDFMEAVIEVPVSGECAFNANG